MGKSIEKYISQGRGIKLSIYISIYMLLLLKVIKKRLLLDKPILIFIIITICFTYYNGSDWRIYEKAYEERGYIEINYSHWESGFKYLIFLFNKLNVPFIFFMIGLKVLTFLVIIKFFLKFSDNFWMSMLLYIPIQGYVLFIDNPLRQMLGIAIVLIATLFSRQKIIYIVFIVLAFQFHRTSIIFLIPLFFNKVIYKRLFDYKYMLGVYLFFYLIVLIPKNVYIIFGNFFKNTYILDFYIRHYIDKLSDVRLSKTLLLTLLYVSIYLYNLSEKKIEEKCKYSLVFFNLYIIVLIFSNRLNDLLRFNLYFSPYFIIIMTSLILRKKSIRNLIIILEFINSIVLIKNSYKYIPYTNFLFSEYKEFEYRKNYHFEYYEKRGKIWKEDLR